jgi:hypothetical protein
VLELAHAVLFTMMAWYVGLALLLMALSRFHYMSWSRDEKSFKDGATAQQREGPLARRMPRAVRAWLARRALQRRLQRAAVRRAFLSAHALPDDFLFASYLSKTLRSLLCKVLEIHWSLWVCALVAVCANYLRLKLQTDGDPSAVDGHVSDSGADLGGGVTPFLSLGYGTMIIFAIVAFKTSRVASQVFAETTEGLEVAESTGTGPAQITLIGRGLVAAISTTGGEAQRLAAMAAETAGAGNNSSNSNINSNNSNSNNGNSSNGNSNSNNGNSNDDANAVELRNVDLRLPDNSGPHPPPATAGGGRATVAGNTARQHLDRQMRPPMEHQLLNSLRHSLSGLTSLRAAARRDSLSDDDDDDDDVDDGDDDGENHGNGIGHGVDLGDGADGDQVRAVAAGDREAAAAASHGDAPDAGVARGGRSATQGPETAFIKQMHAAVDAAGLRNNFLVKPRLEMLYMHSLSVLDVEEHRRGVDRHRARYWFRSPKLHRHLIQLVLFLAAAYLAVMCLGLGTITLRHLGGGGVILMLFPSAMILAIAPSTMADLALISSISYAYKVDTMEEVLDKMEARKSRSVVWETVRDHVQAT